MVSRLDEPLRAYRIADSRHPIFDGTGAATLGGRWNSPGRRVIYASETYAGALLEKLAHTNIGRVPKRQAYVEIEIPAGLEIEILNFAGLGGAGIRRGSEQAECMATLGTTNSAAPSCSCHRLSRGSIET